MIEKHGARVRWPVVAIYVASVVLPVMASAAGLTITPSSVAANYIGTITLNITGLATGQTVVVETFLDTNSNGRVDAGETLVQSFTVTDGQALSIGGVRNSNVPGDEDGGADGKIRAVLNFQAEAEANLSGAKYVYRVSPAAGGFTPVTAPFTITQPAYGQKVVGKVTSGGSGVPFAFVFLFDPARNRGPSVISLADDKGNFTLNTAPGTYAVVAVKGGLLFDFDTAPWVTIHAGATVTQNLSLTAANRTISGRLTDADNGAGIPGLQVFVQSGDPGIVTLVFTDANGDFTIPVSTASTHWTLFPPEKAAALLGSLTLSDGYGVDTGGGNVSGISVQWPKATALIYGTLKDDQGHGVAGVGFYPDNNQYEGYGLSDSNGNYVVGVTAATWWIGPENGDLASRGYLGQGTNVTASAGQALRQDFVARHITARLIGRVVDDAGNPVSNVRLHASGNSADSTGQTDAGGNFNLPVFGGTWHLSLGSSDTAQRGLVRSTPSFNVTDGVDVSGIVYEVRRATAHITGWVKDNTNTPIGGIGVYTYTSVGGIQYDAWRETDSGGNYSLGVLNGSWQVNVNCGDLQSRGYTCPSDQSVTISGADGVANFAVQGPATTATASRTLTATLTRTSTPPFTPTVTPISTSTTMLPPTLSPTPSPTVDFAASRTVTATQTPTPTITPTPGGCIGDCNDDHHVTVDELVKGVNIALGTEALSDCPQFDESGDDKVTVDELVKAVNNALNGCGA